MDPLVLIILLVTAAALLLFGDLFLPSGGILSLLGVAALVTAVVVTFTLNRWAGLGMLFALVLAAPFVAAGMIRAWQATPVGRRMTLVSDTVGRAPLALVRVGTVGRTTTSLRPMGEATFPLDDGTVVEAQVRCETGDLPVGSQVRVVHVRDGQAVVRPFAAATGTDSV